MVTVTEEIGDTWLYGVPSDPWKNVAFREMSRIRRLCVEQGSHNNNNNNNDGGGCNVEDMTMQRFDRLLTKIPEHTWGEDTTWYLSSYLGGRTYPLGDYMNWTNSQFQTSHVPNQSHNITQHNQPGTQDTCSHYKVHANKYY